jgi:ribosomal protein L20A (L18A)
MNFSIGNLFPDYHRGGMDVDEWYTLPDDEKIIARLEYLSHYGKWLAELPYDSDRGLLANVHAEARHMYDCAEAALQALSEDDTGLAALHSFDAGLHFQKIASYQIAGETFSRMKEAKVPRSMGGKSTAEMRKAAAAKRRADAVEHWFSLAGSKEEHERADTIAKRMGVKADTVRGWLRKEGIR